MKPHPTNFVFLFILTGGLDGSDQQRQAEIAHRPTPLRMANTVDETLPTRDMAIRERPGLAPSEANQVEVSRPILGTVPSSFAVEDSRPVVDEGVSIVILSILRHRGILLDT